ncbi:MAG: hypothetical protein JW704_13710 [Anaerolineaceae bacterium]|nr:hypothetical protein [Anaerolineaceae bacterium]
MSTQRFSTGKYFHWQDTTYEVKRLLPEGKLRIENVLTGDVIVIDISTLIEALFAGDLRFAVDGQDDHTRVEERYMTLTDYPEHLVAVARYRLQVIQPLLEMKAEGNCSAFQQVL